VRKDHLDKPHHEIATLLIDAGANVNSRDWLGGSAIDESPAYGKEVPLVSDRPRRILAIIAHLVECGKADIDHPDYFGRAPLMCAVEKGDEAVVRALLERGADVKLQDKDGESTADRVWIQSTDHHDDGENGSMRRIFRISGIPRGRGRACWRC
jgi:ankyrin repeat protein